MSEREYFCMEITGAELARSHWQLDKFILLVVENGTVRIVSEGGEYTLHKNRLMLLRSQIPWRVSQASPDLRLTLIGFPHTMLHERTARMEPSYFFQMYTRMVWTLDETNRRLLEHFKELFRFAADRYGMGYNRELVVALVTGFVFGSYQVNGLRSMPSYPDSSRGRELFRNFMKMVHEHYADSHEVQFYAEQLCISAKYLTQITKHAIGHTPKQILDDVLVREATRLLEKNDCSIQEISNRLGFSDQSHFGRFFRRMTKCSPQQFRLKPREGRQASSVR